MRARLAAFALLLGALLALAALRQAHGDAAFPTASVGRHPVALAIDSRRGRLYVADRVGSDLAVFDLQSGARLADTSLATGAYALAIDEQTGRVLASSDGKFVIDDGVGMGAEPGNTPAGGINVLSMLDANGTPIRRLSLNTVLQDTAIDARAGIVLAAAGDPGIPPPAFRGVVAMSLATGLTRFTVPTGHTPLALGVDTRLDYALAFLDDDSVALIDVRHGSLVRRVSLAGPCLAATAPHIVVDTERARAYLYREGGTCLAILSTRTGALLTTVQIGLQPLAVTVDEAAGRVLCLDAQGGEAILDARTGILLTHRAAATGQISQVIADPTGARVYALADGDAVTVLRGVDGTLVRRLAIGEDAVTMALDGPRHRLLIAYGPGASPAAPSGQFTWLPTWLRALLPGGSTTSGVRHGSVRAITIGT